jgi:transcriptional regulator with XRE-family HTH domain
MRGITLTEGTAMSGFGDLLREARIHAGLNQPELAEKVAVDKSYISKLERGIESPPSRKVAVKLVDALGISEKEDRIKFLSAAGVINDEDLEGFTLVKGGNSPGPQAISPPIHSVVDTQQPPVMPAADNALLHQILDKLEALTATVSHLQADVSDLKQRAALFSSSLPAQLETDQQLLREAKRHSFTGRWEGEGELTLPTRTRVKVPSQPDRWPDTEIAVLYELTVRMRILLTLDSEGEDVPLFGDAELDIDLSPLGMEFTNMVYPVAVEITEGTVEDDHIRLVLQDFKLWDFDPEGPGGLMMGTLSEEGRKLTGFFETVGLLTEVSVKGKFSLDKW